MEEDQTAQTKPRPTPSLIAQRRTVDYRKRRYNKYLTKQRLRKRRGK